jgi:hypothetical protein
MKIVYTSYSTHVARADFRCGKCSFASPVEITATGAGQTQADAIGGDGHAAALEAQNDAETNARGWADVLFELFPCPKCGWRNPERVARFKRGAWIVAGIVTALLAVAAVLVLAEIIVAGAIVGVFGLIMLAVAPPTLLSSWNAPKKQVKLLSH